MIRKLGLLLAIAAIGLVAGLQFARSAPGVQPAQTPVSPPSPTAEAAQVSGKPLWRTLWSKPTPDLGAAHLSADGAQVAWIDRSGSVRRMDAGSGRTLWQAPASGDRDRVAALADGAVAVWADRDPIHARISVLSAVDGKAPILQKGFGAAVWSVCDVPGGLAVGLGDRSIATMILPTTGAPMSATAAPIRLNGIAEQLSRCGGRLLASTWMSPSVVSLDSAGVGRWRADEVDPARTAMVFAASWGATIALISAVGPDRRFPKLIVLDGASGARLWEQDVPGDDPIAGVSADGTRIVLNYARRTNRAGGATDERVLVAFDRAGNVLFQPKGGRFFEPRLAALSATGDRITVCDGDRALMTLDASGRTLGRMTLPIDPATGHPPTIRQMQATPDGRRLLLVRGDGRLMLLESVE